MSPLWLALALLLLLAGGALLWRSQRELRRLRARLEGAALELQSLQQAFSRFAPDEVIDRIIHERALDIGEKREVTVLFADLVGFTELSEQLEPAVLVRILNGYFDRMSNAIEAHRGYVSTFIGDGILALFGALTPNPWQGNDAVHAALAMVDSLETYNAELVAEGLPALGIGIGLHRGTGVAGLVGSQRLKEFSLVGRTVNLAARVQDLTRQHPAQIILTDALRADLDPRFVLEPLPPAEVKGIEGAVAIHAVRGLAEA